METILKLLVGSFGIVAAMGFPAAYLQLARFHIPANVISRSQILEAGIAPAVALILVVGYLVFASRSIRQYGWRYFLSIHGLLLSPLLIVTSIIIFIGSLSMLLLYVWALLWAFTQLAAVVAPIHPTSKDLLKLAAVIVGGIGLAYLVLWSTYQRWQHRSGRPWRLLGQLFKPSRTFPRHSSADKAEVRDDVESKNSPSASTVSGKAETSGKLLLLSSLVVPVTLAIVGYAAKGVILIWDPQLSTVLTHGRILLIAAIGGLIYSGFVATVAFDPKGKSERPDRGIGWVFVVVVFLYLISVGVYSKTLYPRLPLGLGGGKPTAVRLWLPKTQPYGDIASVLRRARVIQVGELVEISEVFVLHSSADYFLLVDSVTPPASAILIPRARFTSVSW